MKTIEIGNINLGEGLPKICIPIISASAEELLEEARAAALQPCDMVEWRADFILDAMGGIVLSEVCRRIKLLLKEIKRIVGRPLIFTIRTEKEGGQIRLMDEGYFYINKVVAETGVADFIDIEAFTSPGCVPESEIRQFIQYAHLFGSRVILSNHDFEQTPTQEELLTRFFVMQELGADVMKLAVMPQNKEDVLNLLEVAAIMKENYAQIPFIAISMGELGVNTRICGGEFGSAITYASGKTASAPGQIDAANLKVLLDNYYRKESK